MLIATYFAFPDFDRTFYARLVEACGATLLALDTVDETITVCGSADAIDTLTANLDYQPKSLTRGVLQ